jgi:hypothetical protein
MMFDGLITRKWPHNCSRENQNLCSRRRYGMPISGDLQRVAERHHQFPAQPARMRHRASWDDGIEIQELQVKSEIKDGYTWQTRQPCKGRQACRRVKVPRVLSIMRSAMQTLRRKSDTDADPGEE